MEDNRLVCTLRLFYVKFFSLHAMVQVLTRYFPFSRKLLPCSPIDTMTYKSPFSPWSLHLWKTLHFSIDKINLTYNSYPPRSSFCELIIRQFYKSKMNMMYSSYSSYPLFLWGWGGQCQVVWHVSQGAQNVQVIGWVCHIKG